MVIFRANDGKPHALHAYCAHMGVHLGIGGKIVNNQCIQCPFHGWLYDGETGTCVGNMFPQFRSQWKALEDENCSIY